MWWELTILRRSSRLPHSKQKTLRTWERQSRLNEPAQPSAHFQNSLTRLQLQQQVTVSLSRIKATPIVGRKLIEQRAVREPGSVSMYIYISPYISTFTHTLSTSTPPTVVYTYRRINVSPYISTFTHTHSTYPPQCCLPIDILIYHRTFILILCISQYRYIGVASSRGVHVTTLLFELCSVLVIMVVLANNCQHPM